MSEQSVPESAVPAPEQKNYDEKALLRYISRDGRPAHERVQDLCGDIEKLAGTVLLSRQPSSQEQLDKLWTIFQGLHEKIGKELKYLRLLLEGAEVQAALAKVQECYDRLQVGLQPENLKGLVEAGKELRQAVERMPAQNPPPNPLIEALTNGTSIAKAPIDKPVPHWDGSNRILHWNGRPIRQYNKKIAENQIKLLDAFEMKGWALSIPDPFKNTRKLSETIRALNKSLPPTTIRFGGDGTGDGANWHIVQSD